MKSKAILFLATCLSLCAVTAFSQNAEIDLHYRVFLDNPADHIFHVELDVTAFDSDTLLFKLPNWMPGYYQLMDYAANIDEVTARFNDGGVLSVDRISSNAWSVVPGTKTCFSLLYDVKATRQFVANSYIDSAHAYLVPAGCFLYVDGGLQRPVSIQIMVDETSGWQHIATGLEPVDGQSNRFFASDFDILYDCPILIGDLEELPSFEVRGVPHRFVGYQMGDFNRTLFMSNLNKVVDAAVSIFDDIPYDQYTFIGIGPGQGGIEHLNNTVVSFDGSGMNASRDMLGVLNFLGHEYFHHYNVKRIRPVELGPFDYDRENRSTQLWVSEGLTVYYEYVLTKMAGLASEAAFLKAFEDHINHIENNAGRFKQSLAQASYSTWEDGPFGKPGRTLSYYQKGPVVGLLIDLAIRHATENRKSLDDVMRYLYRHYYQELRRGFTGAEFQQACEMMAGRLLTREFEYVYTTKAMDYNAYLNLAGLEIIKKDNADGKDGRVTYQLKRQDTVDALQAAILKSWLRD